MTKLKNLLLALACAQLFAAGAYAQDAVIPRAPEVSTGYTEKTAVVTKKFMVAAANPLASEAAYKILKQGGSAVDAAIATQLVLTLVEPQSSGIGGGAFMLHFDGKDVQAYDGRETAPAAATEALFQDAAGKPLGYQDAVVGGRSVGAPGVLRMLEMAHKAHGKLPWAKLFQPAIDLATKGFAVTPRMHDSLKGIRFLKTDPTSLAYFHDKDGNPWPVGHILKNPELARTLSEIAKGGADAFYKGRIAQAIVAKVQGHPTNPGGLSLQDLAGYQAKLRKPVCMDYKQVSVCGMPPPSSGGITVAQILGILENTTIASEKPVDGQPTAQAIHLFTEAGRLAYADRNRYIADTDFVPLPARGIDALIDKGYMMQRAELIGERSMGTAKAGVATTLQAAAWGTDKAPEYNSTSHYSIVDARGNAVAMTTSVEDGFGSRQMVAGFMLNNQLTDFSAVGRDETGPVANRVQPGKRPRSAMSPTLVFDKASKKLLLSTGSPGGSAIINYVAKVLVGTLDWGLNVQQAISLPNFGSRNGPTELEAGRIPPAVAEALKARGHAVRVGEQNSGLQGIQRVNIHGTEMWLGGADPRREGAVRGD
ncbi:MAG TPA: gamma-glutamyltransferase [Burkholderiaceae bacterium]